MTVAKLIIAYFILSLYVITSCILIAIMSHLIHVACKKRKGDSGGNVLQIFFGLTIAGILSFLLSTILVTAVIGQVILIDAHALHEEVDAIDTVYYDAFEEMEYMSSIFDTIGHLCVIFVFIGRFQYAFHRSFLINSSNKTLYILYILCVIQCLWAVAMILLIITYHDLLTITIIEITWEVFVEIMCLWLLYLFIAKLYVLLKISLTNHLRKGNRNDFIKQLSRTLKQSINSSKEKSRSAHSSNSKSKSKSKSKSSKNKDKTKTKTNQLVIDVKPIAQTSPNNSPNLNRIASDTSIIEPISILSLNPQNSKDPLKISPGNTPKHSPLHTPNESPYNTPKHSPEPSLDICDDKNKNKNKNIKMILPEEKEISFNPKNIQNSGKKEHSQHTKTNKDVELTITRTNTHYHSSDTRSNFKNTRSHTEHIQDRDASGVTDLVGLMSKMTLLVLICVFTSVAALVGNIFIEMHHLQTIEKNDVDIQSISAEILPLTDTIVTSLMLYLQFNFTDNIYRWLLGKVDVLFLKFILKLLESTYSGEDDEKMLSFIHDNKMRQQIKDGNIQNNK